MPVYEHGSTQIHYDEAGSGFPLLVIPGGGLNGTIANLTEGCPFNPLEVLSDEFRCITLDQRNASGGQSSGPLEADRPWDSYTDDHLGLMDHLGIDKFLVLGFCIGGPFSWNLIKRAPDRVIAAVLAQPSGFRPERPDNFYNNNMKGWGPPLCERRPEITMEQVDKFLRTMYGSNDFVFTVPEHNPNRRDVELTIDVVDNRLRARLFKKNDYYRGIARLYVFEHETQEVREISINIPGQVEALEDGAEIDIPEFANRSISTSRQAPDGYELLGPGYRRGGSLMTELFGGHRRYQLSIHKSGAVVEIPDLGDHRNYYYGATFLGWVTK